MAHHEVFRDLAESLGNLVRLEAKAQKVDLEVVLGPPDPAFFAGRKSQVAVYLYDHELDPEISQDQDERQRDVTDETGTYTILYGRPLFLVVRVAVAASGKTALEEQANLGLAMKAFFERPVLKEELKLGRSLSEGEIPIDLDVRFTAGKKRGLLRSLGVTHHPLAGYRVAVALLPDRELRRTRKVERRSIELFDKLRPPEGRSADAEQQALSVGGSPEGGRPAARAAKGRS